jgi:hypothetical protein
MRLHLWRILLVLAFSTAAASAQVGIYGNFAAVHLTTNSGGANTWEYGPGAGLYYDFAHLGPIGLGSDLRFSQMWGNGLDYRSGLGGVRLVLKAPVLPVKAYVQGSAGVGATKASGNAGNLPNNYGYKFQYDVFGGADVTLLPRIDWRVAEIGYGRMSGIGNGNSGVTAASTGVFTIGTGIVLRLPF